MTKRVVTVCRAHSTKISVASISALVAFLATGLVANTARADDQAVLDKLNSLTQKVEKQDKKIADLEAQLKKKNAAAPAQTAEQSAAPTSYAAAPTPAHVGEAPVASEKPPEIAVLADVGGVLTPYGTVVVEPFLDYARSSVNSFTFEGVDFVSAVQIGTLSAGRNARDLVDAGVTVRTGVTKRLELEAKVPGVWRQDAFTNSVPAISNVRQTTTANGMGLGDIEVAGHYQINDGQQDWPFFIANMRFKTDTGTSPYTVKYNPDGSARTLATGSGFNAIEPSVTVIYPTDPAVLFGNLGYIHSFDKDVNRTVAGSFIGNVSPGDTYAASVGMGMALNDRLSFSLGYEQDYVRPTMSMVAGTSQRSDTLVVGSALTGLSFKVNNRVAVNLNIAEGVTRDAPDTEVTLRVPITFGEVFGHQ
jgi:hypothetical protein